MGQKFRRNRSISLHFRDKHVFAFKAEIQDVRQKCSISHRFQDKCIFVFYAEIQDGRQKMARKQFLKQEESALCQLTECF